MEIALNLSQFRVLHEVHDGSLPSGNEHSGVAVQPVAYHRAKCSHLIHPRVAVEEVSRSLVRQLVAAEMLRGIRRRIDMRLAAVGSGKHNIVPGVDQNHDRHDSLVQILTRWPCATTLDFDSSSFRTDNEDCSLSHM